MEISRIRTNPCYNRVKASLPYRLPPPICNSSINKNSRRNSSKLRPLAVILQRLLSSLSPRNRLRLWPHLSSRLPRFKLCSQPTTSPSTMRRTSMSTSRRARARLTLAISLTSSNNSSRTRRLPNRRRSNSSSKWGQLSHKAYRSSWRMRHQAVVALLL